jgi:hypothetical protein
MMFLESFDYDYHIRLEYGIFGEGLREDFYIDYSYTFQYRFSNSYRLRAASRDFNS